MDGSRNVMLTMCLLVGFGQTADTPAAQASAKAIWNGATRLEAAERDDKAVGIVLKSGGQTLAHLSFGPNGLWAARRSEVSQAGLRAWVRVSGLDTSGTGGTPKLAADSFIEFSLDGEAPYPTVTFSIGFESFDEKIWQAALDPPAPLYYLTCHVPQAKMLHLGGGLIATPDFEPYPMTRQGCISGNWSPRWSYAAALAAFAVPAFGLWNPDAKVFVGYDFGVARHTDRSSKYLAPAYCDGEGKHEGSMFCLVHPHQKNWVDLTYPKTPSRVTSRFEWIYSRTLPSDADPNEFILTRFVRDHRGLLRPAPRMSNLTWIRDHGKMQFPHVIARNASPALMHHSGPHYLEGAFVELNALMLGSTFPADGVRRVYQQKNQRAIAKLREQIQFLKERAIWRDVGGDRCCVWEHPIEGRFKDRWGGDDCAGVYHKSTWQIATAMMVVYDNEKDESLLSFIDGVYNWTRHFLYTRNGVCDIPWAMFCHIGLAASENFMLTYRHVFRSDPVRGRNMDEALRLARTCAYKSTWFYLADPDETDAMDPTFLGQAVVDRRWIGRVTWNECGWIPRTLIPLYCETGDPFFKYLVRGAAENFFVGYRDDGGITENVQIFGETEFKGRRTAGLSGISNGAQMRRWAEPAGDSPIRICIGEKAAIAFCKNTFDYDVADYAYKPELNCRFRLVARGGAKRDPIDVTLTAPFRDLRTRKIRVNGRPLSPNRIELNQFTDGEDAYVRGVRPGDTIEIGHPTDARPAPSDPLPYRDLPDTTETQAGHFRTVSIASACNERLEMRFGEDGTWYGWLYGLKWRDSVPYYFLDPALNGGRACVDGDAKEFPRLNIKPAHHILAVFGVHGDSIAPPVPIGRLRLIHDRGAPTEIDVTAYRWIDVNDSFPLRKFNAYVTMLSAPHGRRITGVEVLDGRLFAMTTLTGNEELARHLRREFDAAVRLAIANGQRGLYPTAASTMKEAPEWEDARATHRIVLDITPTAEMTEPVLRVPLDFGLLCRQVGAKLIGIPCHLRCVDQTGGQRTEVPAQFDAFRSARGTFIILPHTDLAVDQTRRYAVYLNADLPSPVSTRPPVDRPSATISSGKKGVRFTFGLSAEGQGPRLMDIRFDLNGDGKFAEPSVLGRTGFSGGHGCLTAVYDPYFWFNFGHFQTEPAKARVVHAGPASATVAIDNLQLFGCGGPIDFGVRKEKHFTVGPKGVAQWFFRAYAGRTYLDQWVEWHMDDADTCWTRELQVRYGLANFDPNMKSIQGKHGEPAEARDFCALGVQEEDERLVPVVQRTRDGQVIQVLLAKSQRPGRYASSFWRMAPSKLGPEALKNSLTPPVVEVYALERKEGGRVIQRKPKPMASESVSTLDGPVVAPGPEPPLPGALNWDTSLEKTKQYWGISRDAAWSRKAARTGSIGALLEVSKEKEKKLALVMTGHRVNREMALEPNTKYNLTFWARCMSEKGLLHANLYWGRGYDFEQKHIELPGDQKWHRYEIEIKTGKFPPPPQPGKVFVTPSRIFPALRLWCLREDQVVHVDDVCLTPTQASRVR